MASRDVLKDVLDGEVAMYRNRDFATSLMVVVTVQPDFTSTQLTFGHRRRIGFASYIFTAFNANSTTLAIYSNKSRTPTLTDESRREIHAYLDQVERYINPLDNLDDLQEFRQFKAWNAQQEWWRGNNKSFRLFDLPVELRDAIFTAAISPVIHPYPYDACRRLSRRYADQLVDQSLSLYTVSKQVRLEAGDHFFRHTTFLIEHMPIWTRLLRNQYLVKHIRKVDIDLSLADFMFFFAGGSLLVLSDDLPRCVARRKMREMELTQVTIRLPNPHQLMKFANGTIGEIELTAMCLSAIRPHAQGHMGVKILNAVDAAEAQVSIFREACREARSAYELFRSNIKTLGYGRSTLGAYDEWVEETAGDEDGGVLVPDAKDGIATQVV